MITPADIALGVAREGKAHGDEPSPLAGRWEEMQTLLRTWPVLENGKDSDLPLSNGSKRVLAYAYEESKRDEDPSIRPEHLLRGVLREGDTAAKKLIAAGLDLRTLRRAAPTPKGTGRHFVSRDRRRLWHLRLWLIGAALGALAAVLYLHSQQ